MRRAAPLILIMVLSGWLAATLPISHSQTSREPTPWRRTADGWQRRSEWRAAEADGRWLAHPLTLAALQGATAVTALAAFSGRRRAG